MKISDQALGAIMMALQKSLMEQSDIVPVLKEFDFQLNENEELMVLNPPTVSTENNNINPSIEENINAVGSD